MLDSTSGVRKTDLAVIILQKNEKLHIKRCLEKLAPLAPRQIFVVDCFSTDGSDKIAAEMGATVVYHDWPGNQAAQFNWFLEELGRRIASGEWGATSWVLRLDADEYLYPETIEELRGLVTSGGLPPDVTSLSLSLARHIFGGEIRHGKKIEIVRAFRRGCARYAQTEMDEHLVIDHGRNYKMKGLFVDHALVPFADWKAKHRDYARREAHMAVDGHAMPTSGSITECRVICGRSPTSSCATSSEAAFSMAMRAGCGTSGRASGIGAWWIVRSDG